MTAPNSFYVSRTPMETVGDHKVFLVYGDKIRGTSDKLDNFTDYAIWRQYPGTIPKGEFWIDDATEKSERPFMVSHMLAVEHAMDDGDSYDKAETLAKKIETRARRRALGIEAPKKGAQIPRSKLGSVLFRWSDGMVAHWIDGDYVRNEFDEDFYGGGHPSVYPYVPKGIIIIERGIRDDDVKPYEGHEKTEYNAMGRGKNYDTAHHQYADLIEDYMRHHPDKADAVLKRLGNPKLEPIPGSTIGRASAA